MSVLVLNQSVLHYESLGRGRPVVFLHTWVGSWRYWVPTLGAVSVSHSAYALDLFGYGDSARASTNYATDRQAELVAAFLDEMGIGRVALVGHGLGGLVALHFAASQPERVARMLLVGLPSRFTSATDNLGSLTPDNLLALLDSKGAFSAELMPETRAIDSDALAAVPMLAEIQDRLSSLAGSEVPILIVNGANDPLLSGAKRSDHPTPQPRVHEIVLPESGHFPMLDAPDTFHRLLVDFLALENDASPRELRLKEEWRRRMR